MSRGRDYIFLLAFTAANATHYCDVHPRRDARQYMCTAPYRQPGITVPATQSLMLNVLLAPRHLIFTALEGALVDSRSDSFAGAEEALSEIDRRKIPYVLLTS